MEGSAHQGRAQEDEGSAVAHVKTACSEDTMRMSIMYDRTCQCILPRPQCLCYGSQAHRDDADRHANSYCHDELQEAVYLYPVSTIPWLICAIEYSCTSIV